MTRSEFELMAQQLRAQMLKVALDFLDSKDDAEDVTQDAMLQLWRYCEHIDVSRNVSGLAVRVAKNCCVSYYRKRQVERRFNGADSDVALLHKPDASVSPQEQLEAEDARHQMTEVLALLKPRERELFELRKLDGLSTKQIAEQTGIRPKSVSAMVSGARMKIFLELKRRMKR